MPQVNADRNLLFGIIALQMDFITRDQLVTAMQDWVLDKSQSLGEVLLKKGILAADTHGLLEALVKKHLAQHNNDPEKSLASMTSVGSVKDDLRRVADPDLQASLVRVAARPEAHDPYATRAPSIGEATSTGLRFRILRPYARGGLGEVHVARDEELAREVALKQIQESHADDRESQLRFKLEAEITGGLEHPGIVPVYGLGQYADGRPYYAMRFIRGHSLKEACERFHKADGPNRDPSERSLSMRSLLGRFVDVCNAIAYAHSRGVLHRDLKPGNIMLGKYGETLVVDWGLAKTLGGPPPNDNTEPGEGTLTPSSGSLGSQTVMGSAMGTPQFMSPEQASGRLDQLGPASDVYSLGATLYCLLTGQPPFNDPEVGTVLTKVQRGEFPPPHEVKAGIAKPLEAICLKAMALKPADRYVSPRDLADDIEHWLADERVSAWTEPWSVTARRWVSRHMPLVVGSVTAVLVAAIGLGVATVLLTAANERERTAKEAAERNYQLARQAVDRYHTEVSESVLLHEPGMEPLRKKLLEAAHEYYEKFVAERGDDPGVKGELGMAIYRLAQITGDIDNETKAIALHQQGRAIFATLAAAEPNNPAWQSDLAKGWHQLGRLHKNADQLAAAEKEYQQAIKIWQPLSAAHPQEKSYLAELARSQLGLGNVFQKTRQWEKARAMYETALETRGKLLDGEPKNQEYQRDFALTASNLARVYAALGETRQKAEPAFAQALKAQEALVAQYPRISQYANDLAQSYFNLANLVGPSQDGIKMLDRAAAIWKELVNQHFDVSDFRVNLAESYMAQARIYSLIDQPAKAVNAANNALEIKKRLALEHTGIASYQEDLAHGYFQLGNVYRAGADATKAQSAFQQAIRALKLSPPLVRSFPKHRATWHGPITISALPSLNKRTIPRRKKPCETPWQFGRSLRLPIPRNLTSRGKAAPRPTTLAICSKATAPLKWRSNGTARRFDLSRRLQPSNAATRRLPPRS